MSAPSTTPINSVIKRFLRDKGITQTHLASLLKESPQNLSNKLRKKAIDTDYLMRISIALEHDFFQHFSAVLRKNRIGGDPDLFLDQEGIYTSQKVIALLEENLRLHRQIENLRERPSK